jgi:hypothetical protein
MTYDPNDPNRPFEYPSLEGYSGPPANPYQPVDYPQNYPSGAPPGYPQFPPPYQGYGDEGYAPQPYGVPGYGTNPYDPYGMAQPPGTSGMAIGALVSSLLGVVLCFCFVPSIVGIALGFVAMGQTRRTGEKGHGMALAAVIVGAITIFLGIGVLIIGALAPEDTSSSY